MTKLLNRATFEKDLARFNTKLWLNRSIIILDLNNLKLFNDKKGHDAGDIYITTAGSIIHKVFSPYGRVYRIGGDEFCVISKSLTHKKFLELRTIMEEEINSKNDTNDTIPMRISAGYATYDATLDQTLNDTMKRADKEMYYRKEELKK